MAYSDRHFSTRKSAIYLFGIAFLWLATLVIVNPWGNFPLNDSWAFGQNVLYLLKYGQYRPNGWQSMTLISNVLWGALFTIPAGFSFNALRLSTLVAALLGITGTFLVVRELRQPAWLAVVVALTLCLNPIYYALSCTFMTDVPFTALMILTALFFLRNLNTGSDIDLVIGLILSVAAVLSRQLAIAVPLAFAVSLLLKNGFAGRNLVRAIIPPLLTFVAMYAFNQWLVTSGRLADNYAPKRLLEVLSNSDMLIRYVSVNTFTILMYLGLFLLPVLFCMAGTKPKSITRNASIFLLFVGLLVGWGALLTKFYGISIEMPLTGNTIINSGIGPLTLRDTFFLHLNHVPALPRVFWQVVTGMSLIGAALLATFAVNECAGLIGRLKFAIKSNSGNEVAAIFLILSGIIYLLPILLIEPFDRYLVPVIPFFAAGIGEYYLHNSSNSSVNRNFRLVAYALITAYAVFAICGTRDYLTWNRTRWLALKDLMVVMHVKPADIDGGFEFNGWFLYNPSYLPVQGKSPWWVHGDTYLIGFQRVHGYKVIKKYGYSRWLPPGKGEIVIMKKIIL